MIETLPRSRKELQKKRVPKLLTEAIFSRFKKPKKKTEAKKKTQQVVCTTKKHSFINFWLPEKSQRFLIIRCQLTLQQKISLAPW